MKIPAVWIAAAFATGAAFQFALSAAVPMLLILAGVLILAAVFSVRFMRAGWPAAILALAAWCALGAASAGIERSAVRRDSVGGLIASGRIDTTQPLRWRGRLREDPALLPWGARYLIDLADVESEGHVVAAAGGLRVNYFWKHGVEEPLPALRAGDRVEALIHARVPRNFMDPGAPDTRALLERGGVDLIGTLRSPELLTKADSPSPSLSQHFARARGALLSQIDANFPGAPGTVAILRAMLLGDRMFVDSSVSLDFQKTGAFHVLVLAGLHVGVLCAFFVWLGRKLRLPIWLIAIVNLTVLALYVGVVQDRPPILRAALMAAFFLLAQPFYRRVALLNTVGIAAILILAAHPSLLRDMSFELSFLAASSIAGLALPWIERTSEPYLAGLKHITDVSRDLSSPPKVAQFRIDLRATAERLKRALPKHFTDIAVPILAVPLRLGLRIWELLVLSFALQAGMLALLAFDFHRVTLAGPASNVPAVLLTGVIVPLGFLTLGVGMIWKQLAWPLAWILGLLVRTLLASVHWFASLPRVSFRTPAPSVLLLAATLVTFVALSVLARMHCNPDPVRLRRRQTGSARASLHMRATELAVATVFAILALLAAWHPFRPRLAHGKLEVTVLDVGQGDSIFAAFPDGRTMLIDGGGEPGSIWTNGLRSGPDVGEDVVAPFLWTRGIKRIDVVALTHAHHDHLDGLHAILADFSVGELWVGADSDAPAFRDLLHDAKIHGVKIIHRHAGEVFEFGDVQGAVVWPPAPGDEPLTANNDSLVISLQDGATRFLLPGDIEAKAEKELASDGANVAADFLKVPHHGSKSSSTPEFLDEVAPRFAVISAGEGNPFGHPNESIVERYEQRGTTLFRTDRDGAVTAVSDGQEVSVKSFRETHSIN